MADTPLSDAEWQSVIIDELDPDGTLAIADKVDLYWRMNRGAGQVSKQLQALLTEQRLLPLALRIYSEYRDITANGVSTKDSQVFDHLQQLFAGLPALIAAEQARLAGQRGAGAVGPLENVVPIAVDEGTFPDPNERALRGDPIRRFPNSDSRLGYP